MSDRPHRYWDKMVSAAYLRMLGATQPEAAEAVGRAERTLREWENDDRWDTAREAAKDRWLSDLGDRARARALKLVQQTDDLKEIVTVLERLDERLLPPKQRTELTGADGGPLEIDVDDARQKIERQVEQLMERREAVADAHLN